MTVGRGGSSLFAALDTDLDRRRDELTQFVCELIAVNSQIPPDGDERQIVQHVQTTLDSYGLPTGEVLAARPERPNLVTTLVGGGGGRRLMLNGHLDTKPIGAAAHLWDTDPLTPQIVGGDLHGLGASDMKAACAAMIFAARSVQETVGQLRGDLTLAFAADEEAGARYGARFLAPLIADRADACLIGEPSGWECDFQAVHLVSRGLLCFVVDVTGTQRHSSLSDRMPSINASVKMGQLITSLSRFTGFTFVPHPLGDARPTLNVGVFVEAGVYYGVTPGTARFACDLRALPGMTEASVLADLQAWLDQEMADDPDLHASLSVEPDLPWIPPSEIAGDHPLTRAVQRHAGEVLGAEPPLGIFPGGTDAPWFAAAGLPTLPSFGPGILTWCHGPNERVSIEAVHQAAKVYARTIVDFCQRP